MYDTKKFAVGSPEVYEEMNAMYFPDDNKKIELEEVTPWRKKERQELRSGEKDNQC